VTEDPFVSHQLGASGEFNPWYQRAAALGIEFRPLTTTLEIEPDALVVRHRFGRCRERIGGLDAVVLAEDELADDALYHALAGVVGPVAGAPEVHRIGDCLAPRRVLQAVLEGNRIGRAI
jgi:2,4-dienoyl-CoA reductase (NADPH2)